ncbi:MAG TPA: sarcosine oxidase subunit delta [Solirubrobacteraceae bacterium]|jgi:heterotetrameric sarcosine oxidase delta subunit|nr:sarcosine oxidase subunit delta [Solirubrobacteraceae bacterium]
MSFVLECPHCGVREVADFAFGGELSSRPSEAPSLRELSRYNYFRRNVAGVQREWWYHRSGCRTWFQADRDTRTNTVLRVGLPGTLGDAPAMPEAGMGEQLATPAPGKGSAA